MGADIPTLDRVNEQIRLVREAGLMENMRLESDPIRGLVMMTSPDFDHALILGELRSQLVETEKRNSWGALTGIAFRTGINTLRQPDLFVIDMEAAAEFSGGSAVSMSGVKMVVEVTSSNRDNDYAKVEDYGRSQVPIYMIVDRKLGEILVYSDPVNGKYPEPVRFPVGAKVRLPRPLAVQIDSAEFARFM